MTMTPGLSGLLLPHGTQLTATAGMLNPSYQTFFISLQDLLARLFSLLV